MLKLINQYYSLISGIQPSKEDFNKTLSTAMYLKDNNISNQTIFKMFKFISKNKIQGSDLPKSLWKDSLLEKDVFYYHNEFHITSKPPTWDAVTLTEICEPFFIEMKINFTMQDLIDRFYDKCRVEVGVRDNKTVEGGFKFLLNKYNKFKAPAIDYIMIMIDLASEDVEAKMITNVFDLEKYFVEAFSILDQIIQEAEFSKHNKIIWRNIDAM